MGNYVNFYLEKKQKFQKKVIRNSLSKIEEQLAEIPQNLRTHRAFIINLKKVTQKQGNSSGYRLSLKGIEVELPVSRQKQSLSIRSWNNWIPEDSTFFHCCFWGIHFALSNYSLTPPIRKLGGLPFILYF